VGLSQYFQSASVPELELLSQEPEMSSAKRVRTSSSAGATTTSRYARRRSAPVAPSVKTYVKGCMERMLELKASIIEPADVVPSATGAIVSAPVFQIQQGDTDATRDGTLIHAKRLTFRFVAFDATTSGAFSLRIICFVDRQANGTTPTVGAVLDTTAITSLYNTDTVIGFGGTRYSILYDRTIQANQQIASTAYTTPYFNKSLAMKMPVQFQANNGAAADVLTNNIWFLTISTNSTATIRLTSTLHYTDN